MTIIPYEVKTKSGKIIKITALLSKRKYTSGDKVQKIVYSGFFFV